MADRQYFQAVPAEELEKIINFSGAPLEYAQLQAGEAALKHNKKFYVIAVLWEVEPPTNSRPTSHAPDARPACTCFSPNGEHLTKCAIRQWEARR